MLRSTRSAASNGGSYIVDCVDRFCLHLAGEILFRVRDAARLRGLQYFGKSARSLQPRFIFLLRASSDNHRAEDHHDDDNDETGVPSPRELRRNAGVARRLARTRGLTERHVRFDPGGIGLVHLGRLRHVPLALGALRRKQMPPRRMLPHDFPRPGDLEPFRD